MWHKGLNEMSYKGLNEMSHIKCISVPLYAVNYEDPSRCLDKNMNFLEIKRKYWFSFMGAYQPNYLTKIRKNLLKLKDIDNVLINVTNRWFFETVVYKHQVKGGSQDKIKGD